MPLKPKHQPIPPAISKSFNDGDTDDYEEAERKDRRIVGPALTSADLGPRRERVPLSPVTTVAKSPDVDYLIGSLYSLIMAESSHLMRAAAEEGAQGFDPAQMSKLMKLVDGTKVLTKLRLELERVDTPEELTREEMIEAMEEHLSILKSEDS